jgi:asparagine synthase (glutamine-hydrolysing)
MSAILALFGPGATESAARAMLARTAPRGADASDLWVGTNAVFGVARHAWECEPGFAGPADVVHEQGCVCVTDATLYYRDDLRHALAGAGVETAPDAPPASLVIAAYRAWGERCVERLEGDFAFILWDRVHDRVLAATEFTGKRPLFHASLGTGGATLALASSVRAIAAHPACPDGYDARVIAATISQLWAASDETWHASVRELIAGTTLVREGSSAPRVTRHFTPRIGEGPRTSFDDAAMELRALLERATVERMAPAGPTAVWMSGGWDSPSVFAAGMSRREHTGDARQLLPVSLSYPEGDPGREDEIIASIADHWRVPVRWIDVDTIPLFVDAPRTAGDRDGPYAHTYEHWNRRLATEARALGARVALDGNGGDQLFQVSDIYLADLFRQLRWPTLAREWRTKGGGTNWRAFLRWVALPATPAPIRAAVERLRGRPFLGHLERILPAWLRPDFVRDAGLREWEHAHAFAGGTGTLWRDESASYFTMPAFGRGFRELSGFASDAGVELRSPLLDARVVAFATGRPREERRAGLETKRLLRRAMRGLLPDSVLAPRTHRTGITSAYSDRRMRETVPALLERAFGEPLLLAELGIVEPAAFRRAWTDYLDTGALHVKIPLFLTLHTEFWLRARRAESTGTLGAPRAVVGHRGPSGDVRTNRAVQLSA